MFVLSMKPGKIHFHQMKCTNFKFILALPTHGLKCLVFEPEALKEWKTEVEHPVYGIKISNNAYQKIV